MKHSAPYLVLSVLVAAAAGCSSPAPATEAPKDEEKGIVKKDIDQAKETAGTATDQVKSNDKILYGDK